MGMISYWRMEPHDKLDKFVSHEVEINGRLTGVACSQLLQVVGVINQVFAKTDAYCKYLHAFDGDYSMYRISLI